MPSFSFRALILLAFIILSAVCSGPAFSQTVDARQDQLERAHLAEAEPRKMDPGMEEEEAEEEISQQLDFFADGFFRFSYFRNDDADGKHVKRITDIRLWGNVTYKNIHQLYARVKGEWIDYNKGTQYFYEEENNMNAPRMDVAYYQLNLVPVTGLNFDRFRFKAGRDYYRVGEGLTLDRRGTGVSIETTSELGPGKLGFKGMVVQSIKSDDHWDRSRPDFSENHRVYQALQLEYEFSREFIPFVYWMNQDDKNQRRFPELAVVQEYGHDSYYVGMGFRGELGAGLTYKAEYAEENGRQVVELPAGETINNREKVDAYAFNSEVEYTIRTLKTQPRFSAQYILGSGDRDAGNTLDTVGGNTAGTDYNAFTQFGYVNTGLVFYPNISNLRILRLGAAMSLLRDHPDTVDLELGINVFQYNRVKNEGGFSDRSVLISDRNYVGRELDLYMIWRPFTDLSFMVQYGFFDPSGDVFEDNSNRRYVTASGTIYF